VADRLVIIDRGKMVANGTLKELTDEKRKDVMFAVTVQAPKEDAWAALKSIPTVKELKLAGESGASFRFTGTAGSLDEVAAHVNQFVRQKGWVLKELALRELTLEDVFLGYFKPSET
jgi:ABC-type multidrug transport system ATPase subunit